MNLPAVAAKPIVLPGGGRAVSTGLELPESLEFADWQQIGEALRLAERSLMWWIGDWLRYGERKYGETYAQAAQQTGYDEQTLMNATWVAGKFEFSRRQENLSWNHHLSVASLESETADALLLRAAQEQWSTRELRAEVSKARKFKAAPLTGKYRVIYADPPWKYGDELIDGYGAAEHHYPTCELHQLAKQNPAQASLNFGQ